MPIVIPIVLVAGGVGLGVWWWFRTREPPPPTIGIGTGGGTVGIIIGGGQVAGGGGSRAELPSDPPVEDPPRKAIETKPPPGSTAEDPSPIPTAGQYYWVQTGDTGTGLVGKAYGLPNDNTGRRYRNWEMLRRHAKNQILRGSQAVWDGALEKRHKAPGQHPRGSGNQHPVIWIPPSSEVVA